MSKKVKEVKESKESKSKKRIDSFIDELKFIQESYKANELPLPQFTKMLTIELLNRGNDLETAKMLVQSVFSDSDTAEDVRIQCLQQITLGTQTFYKDKLDKIIDFIKKMNVDLNPRVRYDTYGQVLDTMYKLEILPEDHIRKMLAKKNIKIQCIRNTIPDTFLFKELNDLVEIHSTYYDLDEIQKTKRKKNEKNRKKKEKKRRSASRKNAMDR